jgi:hypothetical protein
MFSILPSAGVGGICAVGALENIYDKYGYDVLDRVLRLIIMTWEGEQKSFSANMMNGLARLLNSFGGVNSRRPPSRKSLELYLSRISPRMQRSGGLDLWVLQRQCWWYTTNE